MIYTIGYKAFYDDCLNKHGERFCKQGAQECLGGDYKGGSVWKTKAEAEQYLAENHDRLSKYEVYGVLADWSKDVRHIEGEPFHRLVKTSQIVRSAQ